MAYDWRRNNVRELRNIVERMIIASRRDELEPADVPPEIRDGGRAAAVRPGAHGTLEELRAEAERQILLAALERNDWHLTRTAKELGLADHASLSKVMRRLGIATR
ncbi:MAG: helix-turn-helix domain-containing protein [Acidimicrobiales bacterium]